MAKYKKLVQIHQPGLGGDPKIFKQIKQAYRMIEKEFEEAAYRKMYQNTKKESVSSSITNLLILIISGYGGIAFFIAICYWLINPRGRISVRTARNQGPNEHFYREAYNYDRRPGMVFV